MSKRKIKNHNDDYCYCRDRAWRHVGLPEGECASVVVDHKIGRRKEMSPERRLLPRVRRGI